MARSTKRVEAAQAATEALVAEAKSTEVIGDEVSSTFYLSVDNPEWIVIPDRDGTGWDVYSHVTHLVGRGEKVSVEFQDGAETMLDGNARLQRLGWAV
jgi:hypothetical protein